MTIDDVLNAPELAQVKDELAALQRPSIRLTVASSSGSEPLIGVSKFGGSPDLPPGMEWPISQLDVPTPSARFRVAKPDDPILPPDGKLALPFVAQIRLEEAKPFDSENLLPPTGILYFFYNDIAYYSDTGDKIHARDLANGLDLGVYDWGTPANWRVFWYNGDLNRLKPAPMPEAIPEQARYQPYQIAFDSETTLPHVETAWIGDAEDETGVVVLNDAEWEAYAELRQEWRTPPTFSMLGYSDDAQPAALEGGYDNVRNLFFPDLPDRNTLSKAGRHTEYRQGRLLLQVDELDSTMTFGRCGRLFFFIREQDLAARDFSKVWARVQ